MIRLRPFLLLLALLQLHLVLPRSTSATTAWALTTDLDRLLNVQETSRNMYAHKDRLRNESPLGSLMVQAYDRFAKEARQAYQRRQAYQQRYERTLRAQGRTLPSQEPRKPRNPVLNFLRGMKDGAVATVKGLYQVVRHPVETSKNIIDAANDIPGTAKALRQSVVEHTRREGVSHSAGMVATDVAMLFVPGMAATKVAHLSKAGKFAKVSEAAGRLGGKVTALDKSGRVAKLGAKASAHWGSKSTVAGASVGGALASNADDLATKFSSHASKASTTGKTANVAKTAGPQRFQRLRSTKAGRVATKYGPRLKASATKGRLRPAVHYGMFAARRWDKLRRTQGLARGAAWTAQKMPIRKGGSVHRAARRLDQFGNLGRRPAGSPSLWRQVGNKVRPGRAKGKPAAASTAGTAATTGGTTLGAASQAAPYSGSRSAELIGELGSLQETALLARLAEQPKRYSREFLRSQEGRVF